MAGKRRRRGVCARARDDAPLREAQHVPRLLEERVDAPEERVRDGAARRHGARAARRRDELEREDARRRRYSQPLSDEMLTLHVITRSHLEREQRELGLPLVVDELARVAVEPAVWPVRPLG